MQEGDGGILIRQILQTFRFFGIYTYSDKIYLKIISLLKYCILRPILHCSIANHIFLSIPTRNTVYFSNFMAAKYVNLILRQPENSKCYGMKISFKIGSSKCAKLIEKKPNSTILTTKNPKMLFVNHGSQHPTIFQKKKFSYPSRATGPKLMILWLYIESLK